MNSFTINAPEGPRWTAAELLSTPDWIIPVPDEVKVLVKEMAATSYTLGQNGSLPDLKKNPTFLSFVAEISRVLISSQGVVKLNDFDGNEDLLRILLLQIGDELGEILQHRGGPLYEVKAARNQNNSGFTFITKTTKSTGFHTDGTGFSEIFPDIIVMAMVHAAEVGGESRLVNMLSIHDELMENHPEVLETLYGDYRQDNIIQVADSNSNITEREAAFHPVFSIVPIAENLRFKYHRHWIEASYASAGLKMDEARLNALNMLDELMQSGKYCCSFKLADNEIIICNNHMVAHDRTAYQDPASGKALRKMLRMWVRRIRD